MKNKSKNIILDRDGVINKDSINFIKSVDEWIPIPGSIEAIAKLYTNGWSIYIATNQSGISRGLFTLSDLNLMHKKLLNLLKEENSYIKDIAFCPHHPRENCQCRKPNPGMYCSLAKKYNFNLSDSIVVGDSLRDLQAAVKVKAKPYLVLTGKGKETKKSAFLPKSTKIFNNLLEISYCLTNTLNTINKQQ